MKTKQEQLQAKLAEAEALDAKMKGDEAERTEENIKSFDAILADVETLQAEVVAEKKQADTLAAAKSFLNDPVNAPKVNPTGAGAGEAFKGLAQVTERFTHAPTIGEQIVNSDAYKKMAGPGGSGVSAAKPFIFEAKGTIRDLGQKATFGSSGTGLDTTVNYINQGVVMLEQQRLTVRDLLSVGQTTQSTVKWIKEDTYTNAADMVAEEGEKPEASFDTGPASADVKKIAVVAKVTDEMWNDFPMLRDYINTRLRFMVESKEEQQLLNGTGVGSQITGLLQTSGIQTQAKGADTNLDAIHKAMTLIRVATGTTGGYEPDGIVMHPTDYQLIRLAKDGQSQYYGGGPFYGAYGNGNTAAAEPGPWGLRVVQTTAISAGTALVGAFKLGAQIWQRDGIRVDSTNTNEDDFNFNRISLRVEERLALAVYRPSAFCKVTSIA